MKVNKTQNLYESKRKKINKLSESQQNTRNLYESKRKR